MKNDDTTDPRRIAAVGPEGRKVSLADLPLVAFRLSCGHLGRDYAVQKRDLIFCGDCGTSKRVTKILAD